MTRDATAPEGPAISVMVDDVEAAYAQAQERGYEIVHPLTNEEWTSPTSSSGRRTATFSTSS